MCDHDPLETYKQRYPLYQEFGRELQKLCEALLQRENIKSHFIEARAKTPESFDEKIHRPGKNYRNPLKELTDLVGVRIIVHYQEDLQRVKDLISREFLIEEFSDKGELLTCTRGRSQAGKSHAFDRFGYLSYHFIVATPEVMSDQWEPFDRWNQFGELCAEIQVRTMLQHVWAAFSHSVMYKNPKALPRELQRDFFGLAALLEMADKRFSALYQEQCKLAETVPQNLLDQEINQVTLEQYLKSVQFPVVLKIKAEKLGFVIKEIKLHNIQSLFQASQEIGLIKMRTLHDILQNVAPNVDHFLSCLNRIGTKWVMDLAFLAELALIIQFRDKLTVEFLVTIQGWDKDVAGLIVNCVKRRQGD